MCNLITPSPTSRLQLVPANESMTSEHASPHLCGRVPIRVVSQATGSAILRHGKRLNLYCEDAFSLCASLLLVAIWHPLKNVPLYVDGLKPTRAWSTLKPTRHWMPQQAHLQSRYSRLSLRSVKLKRVAQGEPSEQRWSRQMPHPPPERM